MNKETIYNAVITGIFTRHYQPGLDYFEFNRSELTEIAIELGLQPPKNLGDIVYAFRYRIPHYRKNRSTASMCSFW